jgi:hypothetical protein
MRDDREIQSELHRAEVDLEIRIAQLKHAITARIDDVKRNVDSVRHIPAAVADHVWPAMGISLVLGALLGAHLLESRR